MRDITQVIDEVLAHVPLERCDMRQCLREVRESAQYSAPELMKLRWQTAAQVLHEGMGDPPFKEPWMEKVYRVWMDLQ